MQQFSNRKCVLSGDKKFNEISVKKKLEILLNKHSISILNQ